MARGVARRAAASDPVEGPWELPDNWRWERLGEVVDLVTAKHKPDHASELEFVGMDAIPPHTMRLTGTVSFASLRSAASAFEAGDVLYGRLRPYLNKVWLASFPGACSGELLVLRPRPALHPAYLAYVLHSKGFVDFAAHVVTGDRPRIGFDTMAVYPVPVPPFEVQQRITANIDGLFAEVAEGEAALRRARSDLETWRKSLLKAAVTGELSADWRAANPPEETGADLLARILEDRRARWHADPKTKGKRYVEPPGPNTTDLAIPPDGWTWATLPLLGKFGRGKSKHRPRNDPRLYGGEHPFVQTGVVTSSKGRITTFDQTYSDFGLSQSRLWPRGTLCITIAANIARTGVLQFDACFPDSVVGLAPATGVESEYVELCIRKLQAELEADAPATAQKNINLETFEELAILLPPPTEQRTIVSTFEEAASGGAMIEEPGLDAQAADLRQSILSAAFRGELVE